MQLSRLAGNFLRTKKSSLLGRYLNIQPPKGGWKIIPNLPIPEAVSTHSRLKAAGFDRELGVSELLVSTHSRLKAAGSVFCTYHIGIGRFNTQPPEGGWTTSVEQIGILHVSTHSRLKAAGNSV